MISRRTAIKIIFLVSSAIIFFLLVDKWLKVFSLPKLSLLDKKKSLIAEIAEVIIPGTDTPGAKDAHVEDFIIGMIEFCSDRKTQNNFIIGLLELENYAIDEYGSPFVTCDSFEQSAILTFFEKKAHYQIIILNKVRNKLMGKPFIIKFKELTVEGYCTSELGATRGLAYDYIPEIYNACIRLEPNQRAWATK